MVQIRDCLSLLDGQANLDSASFTASLAANLAATPSLSLNLDLQKQLASEKLHSSINHTDAPLSEDDIDIDTWLTNVCQRIGRTDFSLLKQACDFVKARKNQPSHIR